MIEIALRDKINKKLCDIREQMTPKQEEALVNAYYDAYEAEGFTKTYCSPYEQHQDCVGQKISVIGRADKNKVDLCCLPMWTIRFEDGFETLAYPEEIIPSEISSNNVRRAMISKVDLDALRAKCVAGKRVMLVKMDDKYSKMKPGDYGTIRNVDDIGTIFVKWDCGSSLGVVYEEDVCVLVDENGSVDPGEYLALYARYVETLKANETRGSVSADQTVVSLDNEPYTFDELEKMTYYQDPVWIVMVGKAPDYCDWYFVNNVRRKYLNSNERILFASDNVGNTTEFSEKDWGISWIPYRKRTISNPESEPAN